ncbi:MAG: hypothetical protein AMXMBFR13_20160 [Phycisphaerae bacterium]
MSSFKLLALAVIMGAGMPAALAQNDAPSTLYRLTDKSTWQRGCFEPCLCPISLEAPVSGTFVLTPEPSPALFATYTLTEIRWMVTQGDQKLSLTGQGTYRIRTGGEPAHQLLLDLQSSEGTSEHYDSGLIPGGSEFPAIDIIASINGMYCFDTAIHVVAEPAKPATVYRLGKGSTYQQGCFDRCACPLREPVPITGTFLLAFEEQNPLFTVYSVSNIDSYVTDYGDVRHLSGSGTYEVGGEFAITHRLRLELRTNAGPVEPFDSGYRIGGSEFPAIDIEFGLAGEVCLDTVIRLLAKPVGDFDLSGSVDQSDFGSFQACLSGPSTPPPDDQCDLADLDDDGDVDQADFGLFQRCITGPDALMDPACAQ